MIVIGYNNGHIQLKRLLDSLINIKHCDECILILDTGSNISIDIDFFNTLNELYNDKLKIITEKLPYSGYCSGAYIYAMKNYIYHPMFDGYFCFLQDSVEFKSNVFFELTNSSLSDSNVVTIYTFPPNQYDSENQAEFVKNLIGNNNASIGIFGPMFSITKNAINKLHAEWLHIPKNKFEEMGMERAWGVMFNNAELTVSSIEGTLNWKYPFMPGKYINKYFGQRQ
jgi:hypothetical protein